MAGNALANYVQVYVMLPVSCLRIMCGCSIISILLPVCITNKKKERST
jgi:hypothetical protein